MNINTFFIGVIGGLLAIFFLFEPLNIKQKKFNEIPVFELESFKLKELNNKGLTTIMNGSKGLRYKNRYVVYDIDYTDNTKEFLVTMTSNKGVYKGDILLLNGDVVYKRKDGIKFLSQEGTYSKKTNTIISPTDYVAYMGESKLIGSSIEYNNVMDTVKSKNVRINYKLKESK